MAGLALAVFGGAASIRGLDAVLPQLAHHFGLSIGAAGLAVSAYALSYSCFQLVYGPLGDRVGPYKVIVAAAFAAAAGSALCVVVPSFGWLVAARFLTGAAAAALGPLTLLWIGQASSESDRPVLVARMTAASILGTTAGQAGGGLLAAAVRWEAVFLVIAILFAGSGALLAWTRRREPQVALVGRRRDRDRTGGATLGELIRMGQVRAVLGAVAVEGFALYAALPFAAPLLHGNLGTDETWTSLLVGCFGLGGLGFVLFAGPVVRAMTESRRAGVGGALVALGLALLPMADGKLLAGASLMIAGIGFFMMHNVLQVRATRMAPGAPGAAVSLFAALFFFAQALGATMGGICFDRFGPGALFLVAAMLLGALGAAMAFGLSVIRTERGCDDQV